MFVPSVGQRVKLRRFELYHSINCNPWAWLRVDSVDEAAASCMVTILDGDKDTGVQKRVLLAEVDPPLGWRERKPGEFLFEISPDKVEMVRDWFKNRGGVLRWTNKDLGNCGAPDKITPAMPDPGETKQAPGWAYVGESFPVEVEDIGVRTETAVPLPPEWFPVCDRCDGTGCVSVASLAEIRKESPAETLTALRSDGRAQVLDDNTVRCWCCDGTGHKERYIQVRVKKAPWIGYDLFDAGKAKAERTAKKLGPDVKWDWENWGYGLARLRFYRESIVPFTL
jgi:hypothetical protein